MPKFRYRVCVFDDPKGEWRDTFQHAKDDAIHLGLASYDESRREYYLSAPVRIEKREL